MGEIAVLRGKFFAAAILLLFILTGVGCAVRRVDFNEPITVEGLQFIKIGETSLHHVVERIGSPEDITLFPNQIVAEFQWSTTRSASLNLGYLFKLFSPVSPSMTMSGTEIYVERLLLTCDAQFRVRSYAFGKSKEHAFFEFWPF